MPKMAEIEGGEGCKEDVVPPRKDNFWRFPDLGVACCFAGKGRGGWKACECHVLIVRKMEVRVVVADDDEEISRGVEDCMLHCVALCCIGVTIHSSSKNLVFHSSCSALF